MQVGVLLFPLSCEVFRLLAVRVGPELKTVFLLPVLRERQFEVAFGALTGAFARIVASWLVGF